MKKIGEILIENGSLTRTQLEEALRLQKKQAGKLLGQLMIEMGFVTEEDIVVALTTQYNLPYLPVGNITLPDASELLIPKELIQKYLCIPLERMGHLLTVVIADPTNEEAIQSIEKVANCKVLPFIATTTEIVNVIRHNFHLEVLNQIGSPSAVPVPGMGTDNQQPKTA